MDSLITLLLPYLGWPAMALGICIAFIGILLQKPKFVLVGTILTIPMCLYFFGANNWISVVFPSMPLILVCSWIAVTKMKKSVSWGLFLIYITGIFFLWGWLYSR